MAGEIGLRVWEVEWAVGNLGLEKALLPKVTCELKSEQGGSSLVDAGKPVYPKKGSRERKSQVGRGLVSPWKGFSFCCKLGSLGRILSGAVASSVLKGSLWVL